MDLSLVLTHFEGVKQERQHHRALCPAHDDHKPSLYITEGKDGRILIYCQTGCDTNEVLRAAGLEMVDLFPSKEQADLVVAQYEYRDPVGTLVYIVERRAGKRFLQRRPDGVFSINGVERYPYRLPQVLKAVEERRSVFVVEGEKDVHTLERLGFVATCNSGGAGKWDRTWGKRFFKGAKVVVLPDNDDAGLNHALAVANSLRGHARSIKMVTPPDVADKGDVTDWVKAGGDAERLRVLVECTDVWQLPKPKGFYDMADLQRRGIPAAKWVIDRVLPQGVTLLAGDPKAGKSFLALNVALGVASGGRALGQVCLPGRVLYLSLEDNPGLLAGRVNNILNGEYCPTNFMPTHECPNVDNGMQDYLDGAISATEASLVVIDTLAVVRSSKESGSAYAADYAAIRPFKELGDRHGVSFLILHHTNKGERSADNPFRAVSGTQGLTGAVDALMLLQKAHNATQGVLNITGRAVVPQDLAVSFDPTTFTFTVMGDAVEWKINQNRLRVLRCIEEFPDISITDIAQEIDMPYNTVRQMAWRLHREGFIDKQRVGRETLCHVKSSNAFAESS